MMDRAMRDPKKLFLLTPLSVFLMLALGQMTGVRASPIDDENQPEASDPSAYYDEPADRAGALNAILTMPEANEDSFDLPDGVKGTRDTTRTENILPPTVQTSFNYPTNGKPSPLYGAQPFTQQLVLFEEFGPEKLDPTTPAAPLSFPPAAIGPAPRKTRTTSPAARLPARRWMRFCVNRGSRHFRVSSPTWLTATRGRRRSNCSSIVTSVPPPKAGHREKAGLISAGTSSTRKSPTRPCRPVRV